MEMSQEDELVEKFGRNQSNGLDNSINSYISGQDVLKDSQDAIESGSGRSDSVAFLQKYSELVQSYEK